MGWCQVNAEARTRRLIHLYQVRAQVLEEIHELEAAVEREATALRKAKVAAAGRGVRISRVPVAECGTDGGYFRHRRTLKEDACPACKLAHRMAERDRAERRALQATG